MDSSFLIFFLAFESAALVSNILTLKHILDRFNVKVHVFTMILIDAIFTNVCLVILIILDFLLLMGAVERTKTYCTLSQASLYMPFSCGAFVTFLVATARYILTKKSSRNKFNLIFIFATVFDWAQTYFV